MVLALYNWCMPASLLPTNPDSMSITKTLKSIGLIGSASLLSLLVCSNAQANYVWDPGTNTLRIKSTAEGQTPSAGSWVQDTNGWSLAAVGNQNTGTLSPTMYVPSRNPSRWYPGPPNTANAAVNGARWITWVNANANGCASATPAQPLGCAVSPYNDTNPFGSDTNPPAESYNWIAKTTFTAQATGTYSFSGQFTGDNQVSLYFGGAVQAGGGTYGQQPTITGGDLLGQTTGNSNAGNSTDSLNNIYTVSKTGLLLQKDQTYTLYYVVTDFNTGGAAGPFGSTGFLAVNTAFTQQVPGPLPILGAGAFFGYSRRLRRRVKQSLQG